MASLPTSFGRSKTTTVDNLSVDFMVLQFSCVDSSVFPSLGMHSKETRWVIAVGLDAQPIDVKLTVDKSVAKEPQVGITCDGKQIYPDPKGDKEKDKLVQNFVYQWPFRGTVFGINTEDYFEVRPDHLGCEHWYPATLVEQRENGRFKANVTIRDKTVVYQAVTPANIREAGTKQKLALPKKSLVLRVPQHDPLNATLGIDAGGLITHFFARPTPPFRAKPGDVARVSSRILPPKITFKVNKERTAVDADIGREALRAYLSDEARALQKPLVDKSKLKKTWMFQLGPYAEHVVVLERKYKASKVVTLTVDHNVLAEGTAEDLESPEGYWLCNFRFFGERHLDWQVYESDGEGRTLDSTGVVSEVTPCVHECAVYFDLEHIKDLSEATLRVAGRDFMHLHQADEPGGEQPLSVRPEALMGQWGLHVPYKCTEPQDAFTPGARASPAAPPNGGGLLCWCLGAEGLANSSNDIEVPIPTPRR